MDQSRRIYLDKQRATGGFTRDYASYDMDRPQPYSGLTGRELQADDESESRFQEALRERTRYVPYNRYWIPGQG